MTKNRLKKTVALGLGLICTFNFNVSEGLTETNSKANLKNSILEKNNNLENKNFLNTRKTSKNNNQDNLNKYLKYGAIGVGFLGGICSLYELGVLIKNCMSKPVEPEKEIPPFAGLTQSGMNCYVNATLQVLYEDFNFRKYVEAQAKSVTESEISQLENIIREIRSYNISYNNENSAKKRTATEKLVKIQYKYLDCLFKTMNKYKGSYVPHNDEKMNFEKAILHIGTQRDITEILEHILLENPNLPLNRYNYLHELGTSFNTQVDSFDIDNHDNKSCIIDIGRSFPGRNRSMEKQKFEITLPEQIKNKKLKAIALHSGSTGNGGHWVAYKADDNGAWWKCDGSSVTKEFSDTKSFINNTYIKQNVALAYYQNQ